MHRGVLGGGTVSQPGAPSLPDELPGEPGADPAFGRRHVLAVLAVFAVVVVALATWGRDVRSAKADRAAADVATGAIRR